ncbi:MAG: hypothetical protein IKH57_15985 [Clostridia bacterium]|nr:hypothetical protein [Clostridia bacterium]
MKTFCVREMRREYVGVTRLYTASTVIFLLFFAFLGIGMHVRQTDMRYRILLIGLVFFTVLEFLGLHLILTDEKRLLRKTPFGLSLSRLGKPEEIMQQIDGSAEKRYDRFISFALMKDWLMIYYACGWKYDAKRVCALPIPLQAIQRAEILPEYSAQDPERKSVRLICEDGRNYEFYLYRQQEWDALREWLKEQEQTAV